MPSPFSSRLDTNYRPTNDEILAIQEKVVSDTNAAQQVDKQVQSILESIAGLILARDERISSAKKHAALLHPIRKVPEDILSAIFHRCIPHNPSDAPVT
ncbi:hypothetical protein FA13DRAFT_1735894 [Coprinellus micaceus]|uniref:F-box domain-containing protein n=1 Tax=Coprinellus micaceus TaxID=71717 RepID=A0A4Y7T2A0_COPMI|nr:hypothetical protein FA13DRAFT_1735894 [Coprinellus micaceus]